MKFFIYFFILISLSFYHLFYYISYKKTLLHKKNIKKALVLKEEEIYALSKTIGRNYSFIKYREKVKNSFTIQPLNNYEIVKIKKLDYE